MERVHVALVDIFDGEPAPVAVAGKCRQHGREVERAVLELALQGTRPRLAEMDVRRMGGERVDLALREAEAGEMRVVQRQLQARHGFEQRQRQLRRFEEAADMRLDGERDPGIAGHGGERPERGGGALQGRLAADAPPADAGQHEDRRDRGGGGEGEHPAEVGLVGGPGRRVGQVAVDQAIPEEPVEVRANDAEPADLAGQRLGVGEQAALRQGRAVQQAEIEPLDAEGPADVGGLPERAVRQGPGGERECSELLQLLLASPFSGTRRTLAGSGPLANPK